MTNEEIVHQRRKTRFNWAIRFCYLLSIALIASGLYIIKLENIARNAGLDDNTDYFEYEPVDNQSQGLDFSKFKSLTQEQIKEYLSKVNRANKETFDLYDDLEQIIYSLSQSSRNLTVNKTHKEYLKDLLKRAVDVNNNPVSVKQESLDKLLSLDSNLKDALPAGRSVNYIIDPEGNINYLAYEKSIRQQVYYVRLGNTFISRVTNKATSIEPVIAKYIVQSSGIDQTLIELGVRSQAAREIANVYSSYNVDFTGATISILAKAEYIGSELYSKQLTGVEGVQIVKAGKSYYAYYSDGWVGAQGYTEVDTESSTWDRFPFNGQQVRISSQFNPARKNPVTGKVIPHNGTDFAVPSGTPVFAPADGEVTRVTYQSGGAGNYIVISHGSNYKTVYMHLSRAIVRVGDRVRRGQLIAYSGNTGRSTGAHLHYEIHVNNIPRNPETVPLPSVVSLSELNYNFKIKKRIIESEFQNPSNRIVIDYLKH